MFLARRFCESAMAPPEVTTSGGISEAADPGDSSVTRTSVSDAQPPDDQVAVCRVHEVLYIHAFIYLYTIDFGCLWWLYDMTVLCFVVVQSFIWYVSM